jgi:hypothetical protein
VTLDLIAVYGTPPEAAAGGSTVTGIVKRGPIERKV